MAKIHRKSRRGEESDAKDFNGKRVAFSGSRWSNPGDVKTDKFLIQRKDTDSESVRITKDDIAKHDKETMISGGKIPLWTFGFLGQEFVWMRKSDLLHIINLEFLNDC